MSQLVDGTVFTSRKKRGCQHTAPPHRHIFTLKRDECEAILAAFVRQGHCFRTCLNMACLASPSG